MKIRPKIIKKKTLGIACIYFAVIMLFMLPQSPVKAEIKTFSISDSFEDSFQNKIYSQYDNSTVNMASDTVYLRINVTGNGDANDHTPVGDSPNHACVDEVATDEDTTYLWRSSGTGTDYFETGNYTGDLTSLDIAKVTVWVRAKKVTGGTGGILISTHSVHTYFAQPYDFNWNFYTEEFILNPFTSLAWTWEEIDDFQIGCRSYYAGGYIRTTQVWAMVEVTTAEYIDSITTEQVLHQNTTSYTAYSGLKSFIYDAGNYQNISDIPLMAYRNACIIIDIGFLDIFPQSIQYLIRSDVPTNLSLVLENSTNIIETLLDTVNNQSTFRRIRKNIVRESFYLNETSYKRFYFRIDFNSSTPIFLDDLTIRYNDLNPLYDISIDSWTGTDLDDINYEYSDSYLNVKSGLNSDNKGINYTSISNNFFTRRMFSKYDFWANSTTGIEDFGRLAGLTISQISCFSLDTEYRVIQTYEFYPDRDIIGNLLHWEHIFKVYKEDELIHSDVERTWMGSNPERINQSFDLSIELYAYQETDYSLLIGSDFKNKESGNGSSTRDFVIRLNDEIPKNSLMIANVTTDISFFTLLLAVNPQMSINIFRSVSHSDAYPVVEPNINFFNNMRWDNILSIAWNLLTAPIRVMIGFIKFCIAIYSVCAMIANMFSEFKTMFGDFDEGFEGVLDEDRTDAFDNVDTSVQNNLAGYSEYGDMGDIWSDYNNRDWGNLDNSFGNFFPSVDYSIISQNEGLASGFWSGVAGFGITDVWTPSLEIFQNIIAYITLFIIMFFMSILMRLLKGDFEGLIRDGSRIVHAVQFVINAIIRIFEWIFEIISLILNIAIPFT